MFKIKGKAWVAIMRSSLKKWMVWVSVAAAAVLLFIRLVAIPEGWLPSIAGIRPQEWITFAVCGVVVILFILCRLCREPAAPIDRRQLASVSTVSILCGAALLLCTLFDLGSWILTGKTPPPNEAVISGVDGALLMLTILFGIWGGAFLMRLGFTWMTRDVSEHGRMRLMALTPMIWGWMRLARYVVSYASAVDIKRNLSEFLMLIFTILFFFSFARYVGAVGKPEVKSPMLIFYACSAMILSVTSAVFRLAGYWMDGIEVYATQMAGAADLAVGLMALALIIGVAYTRRTDTVYELVGVEHPEWLLSEDEPPQQPTEEPAAEKPEPDAAEQETVRETTAQEAPAPAAPAAETAAGKEDYRVDDILDEIYKDKP